MQLKGKLLVRILSVLLTGIAIVIGVSLGLLVALSPSWLDSTEEQMVNVEIENIRRVTGSKSQFFEESFTQAANDIRLMNDFATMLYSGDLAPEGTVIQSYCGVQGRTGYSCPDPPGDRLLSVIPGTEYFFFPRASAWYQQGYTSSAASESVNETSLLDYVFRSVQRNDPRYMGVYIGTEESKLFRQYPFRNLGALTEPLSDCYQNGQIITPGPNSYDPTCRGWYDQARAPSTQGQALFTSPYTDASQPGVLLITVSTRVTDDDGNFYGVLGIDLSIRSLADAVTDFTILENGYGYVVDRRGLAVIHPDYNFQGEQFADELEFEDEVEREEFQDIFDRMKLLGAGEEEFQKDGETWFISFAAVNTSGYALALVVPESDIVAPATAVRNQIRDAITTQIIIFVVVVGILTFLIFAVTNIFVRKIVGPVAYLSRVCDAIKDGKDVNDGPDLEMDGSVEIKALNETFRRMTIAIKFNNSDFYSGQTKKALDIFLDALDMFQNIPGSWKSIGKAQNNIATVYLQMQEYSESERYFKDTIQGVREKLYNYEPEDENIDAEREKIELEMSLSTRIGNFGAMKLEQGEEKLAEELLNEALQIDRKLANPVSFTSISQNLIGLYIKQERFADAKEISDEAYTLAFKSGQGQRFVDKDFYKEDELSVARSRALYNRGLVKKAAGDRDAAISDIGTAISRSKYLPSSLQGLCLNALADLYTEKGKERTAEEIRELSPSVGQTGPKDIAFVLDYSGSMAGGRIKRSLRNMIKVFDEQVKPQDRISFTTFNDRVHPILDLQEVGGKEESIRSAFQSQNRPNRSTAFYDAVLYAARELLKNKKQHTTQWIVALTDGEDNSSSKKGQPLLDELNRFSIDGLLLVTVGKLQNSTFDFLESMCKTTEHGAVFKADTTDAIDAMFAEVSAALTAAVQLEAL